MHRLTALTTALAFMTAACRMEPDPGVDSSDESSETGDDHQQDGPEVVDDSQSLVPAKWPEDLHRIGVAYHEDGTTVVIALNEAGEPIAYTTMALLPQAPNILELRVKFADGRAWALTDLTNNTVVSAGAYPQGEEWLAELALRIAAMDEMANEEGIHLDRLPDGEEGPWLECALTIIAAVFKCIPVGVQWIWTCPEGVIDAVCACFNAVKGKKKKKKPEVCENSEQG